MMKIIGVIPARYNSSRLPGKPLVDICGKPMIWWVYQQAIKVKEFTDIIVATDDERIEKVCLDFNINVLMTSKDGNCLIDRLYEVSLNMKYDYYVSINGDEPLIESELIHFVFPNEIIKNKPVARGLMRKFTDPVEVIDPGNLKLVCNNQGKLLYVSRSPVPYPQKTTNFTYKKYVGVECYNQNALQFYYTSEPGEIEKIEDLGHLRFVEYGIPVYFSLVKSNSLSVDTPRDLEKVRQIMRSRLHIINNDLNTPGKFIESGPPPRN
jgi:3-deoxy-manno-octulosonate cytidylyltransferase (CMP-KDO synthetase)